MENHGALVGWTHQALGDQLMLKIETVQSMQAAQAHDPDVLRIMLTKNQAAILGNYLLSESGLRQVERPSLFKRLFA